MMRAAFHLPDLVVLGLYVVLTLGIGFWKRQRTTEDYLIGSRSLGLPVFVATVVATWYGGILGVGELTYRYGLVNWTIQGLPYYLFAIVFALWLAPRVRIAGLYTIPDRLAQVYGRWPALLGAGLALIMVTPAPYVLMVGAILQITFGWSLLPALIVGTLFSVAYVYAGGFQSDVRINVFQFVLMFLGLAVALAWIVLHTGGPAWLAPRLPAEHLKLDGGLGLPFVVVWFFIALWTMVDPGFHQRCYAARTPAVARAGLLIAVGCWMLFDVLTTSLGLYARAIVPGIADAQATLAYPRLAEAMLPAGIKGLFYVAMLATVTSTVVSYTFLGAMTVGRDLIYRLRAEATAERVPTYTRIGIGITSVLAVLIAWWVPSVVRQWWAIGTVCVPGLLLPVIGAYADRLRVAGRFAAATLAGGPLTAGACLAMGWARHGMAADVSDSALFPFGVQPMYPGLAIAGLIWCAGLISRRHDGRPVPRG